MGRRLAVSSLCCVLFATNGCVTTRFNVQVSSLTAPKADTELGYIALAASAAGLSSSPVR